MLSNIVVSQITTAEALFDFDTKITTRRCKEQETIFKYQKRKMNNNMMTVDTADAATRIKNGGNNNKKLFTNEMDVHLYLDRLSSLGVNGQQLLSPKTDNNNDTIIQKDEENTNSNLTSPSSLLDLFESNSIPTNLEFEYKHKNQQQQQGQQQANHEDPLTYSISLASVISHHEFVQKRRERLSNLNNMSLSFSDQPQQEQRQREKSSSSSSSIIDKTADEEQEQTSKRSSSRHTRQHTSSMSRRSLLQAGAFSKVFELEQTKKREEKEHEMFDALFPERICVNPDRKTFYQNPVLDDEQQPQDDSNKVFVVRDVYADESTDDEREDKRRFSIKMLKGRMSWMGTSSSSSSKNSHQENASSSLFRNRFSNLESSTTGLRKSRLARLSALMASLF